MATAEKKKKKPLKTGASSGQITNLNNLFWTFDIYVSTLHKQNHQLNINSTLIIMQLIEAGSAITNGREPRNCLGPVFNSKLGCIATLGNKYMIGM
jgi:hypothetical protein